MMTIGVSDLVTVIVILGVEIVVLAIRLAYTIKQRNELALKNARMSGVIEARNPPHLEAPGK